MGPGFESLKVYQWPVGQAVKTPASHAGNGSSILPRVTIFPLDKSVKMEYNPKAIRSSNAFDIKDGQSHPYEFVLIVVWVHLFPSRTQKLSTRTLTIVAGRLAVKISNANTKIPP